MKKTKGQKRKLTVEDDDNSTDSFGVASNVSGTEDMPEVGATTITCLKQYYTLIERHWCLCTRRFRMLYWASLRIIQNALVELIVWHTCITVRYQFLLHCHTLQDNVYHRPTFLNQGSSAQWGVAESCQGVHEVAGEIIVLIKLPGKKKS